MVALDPASKLTWTSNASTSKAFSFTPLKVGTATVQFSIDGDYKGGYTPPPNVTITVLPSKLFVVSSSVSPIVLFSGDVGQNISFQPKDLDPPRGGDVMLTLPSIAGLTFNPLALTWADGTTSLQNVVL